MKAGIEGIEVVRGPEPHAVYLCYSREGAYSRALTEQKQGRSARVFERVIEVDNLKITRYVLVVR